MFMSIPSQWRGLLAAAITVMTLAVALPAAHAAPVVATPAMSTPVTVTDNGSYWTLDNGVVKATISKNNGIMRSLVYHGVETMGGGGIWEQTPQFDAQLTNVVTIDPAANDGARGEVAIKGVTDGRRLDMEIRYALGRGDSGIYAYAIFSHPTNYGAMSSGESRYITKLSHDFNWISVDTDRNMLECTPEDWGNGVVIHAKEQRILNTGNYKNSVEHKYSYNAIQYKIPAYGWSSTKDHIGIWFINPTTEYLGGGSSKMELVCHYDANDNPDPIILDYWSAGHYAGGASCNLPAGEDWSKVVGPIFVYVNSLSRFNTATTNDLKTLAATAGDPTVPPAWTDNAMGLWRDALAQAKKEKAQWPYDWVNGVDYPHKAERGTVSGQLVLDDQQAKTKKLPGLTVGLSHPDYAVSGRRFNTRSGNGNFVTWDHDGNYYQFWNDGSANGKFTIPNVRPGTYTLHAFAGGVLGEFAATNIIVVADKILNLDKLDWKPVRYGKQIWEIGYPDRTGDEFYKGDAANYWLWGWPLRYPLLFPNDVTYTIGKSNYRKDWLFEEVPHATNLSFINPAAKDPANQRFGWIKTGTPNEDMWRAISHGRATTWTVNFNMKKAPKGVATLRVALAGSDGTAGLANPGAPGGLEVGVNDKSVGSIRYISTNAIRYNTDKGVWRQYLLQFDASLLKPGENTMTFTVPAGEVTSGVVWDYLRLELDENTKPDDLLSATVN